MIGSIFYHLGAYFSRILPDGLPQAIAWIIGQVSCLVRWRTRRVVVENLRIIHAGEMDDRALRRRSREVILNFARSIQIFLEMPFLNPEDVLARSDFSAFDEAVAALGGGDGRRRPFIIATAHMGPWELGGYCLSRKGYKIHTVALEHPSAGVTNFFSIRRELVGLYAHPLKGSFHLLKAALDRGESVALLIDRAYSKAKKQFTLFGVESEFPLGHLLLSMRCDVPVLTGAFVFEGSRRYRYVHGGTHYPDEDLGEVERLESLQDKCLRDLERIVHDHSDQWFYFQPLSRTESYGD